MTKARKDCRASTTRAFIWAAIGLVALTISCGAQAARKIDGIGFIGLEPIGFTVFDQDHKFRCTVGMSIILELKPKIAERSVRPFLPNIHDQALPLLMKLWQPDPRRYVPADEIKRTLMPLITAAVGLDKVEAILIHELHERVR